MDFHNINNNSLYHKSLNYWRILCHILSIRPIYLTFDSLIFHSNGSNFIKIKPNFQGLPDMEEEEDDNPVMVDELPIQIKDNNDED